MVKGASTYADTLAAFQVENTTSRGEAAWLRLTHADNPEPVLSLLKHPDANADFVSGWNRLGLTGTRKFYIDKNGTYHSSSDFAESLPTLGSKEAYAPGDVLVISTKREGAVEKCARAYDGAVIGVYSTRPGFVGADKDGVTIVGPDEIPVAIVGIVPVKASAENGPIQPGDLLATSATPGHAMRCEGVERCFGRTLGKALESLDEGTGIIKMLVVLQ
jgi:hypothetical protein